jgi:hypothetical protein
MGMDAFSVKKGHVYDTHIVDLQRHRTLRVLEGRSKDAVVAWLRSHTAQELAAVEVVVTDTSSVYAAAGGIGFILASLAGLMVWTISVCRRPAKGKTATRVIASSGCRQQPRNRLPSSR